MMNKKAFMMMGARKIVSIVMGLILLALGIIPLLFNLNVIGFTIPPLPAFILWTIAMVGAVVLIIDGFHEIQEFGAFQKSIMVASFVVALVIFVYGINVFVTLPFALPVLADIIIDVILVLAGILLVIGGFLGF